MSHEIELKLALAETGPERLLCHPLLRAGVEAARRLTNTYYDTPEGELEAARVALRLRRYGEHRVQTLKSGGEGTGGYSRRREWEWPVEGDDLDREGLAGLTSQAGLEMGWIDRLEPRFTTDFERRIWQLDLAQARIEVALDQGEIRAADRRVPIRELELELKDGDPQALWSLALSLAESVPLRPADASKAARGGALLTGHWTLPQGESPSTWLHRALLALDAFGDTGEDDWRAAAREAFGRLADGGEDDARRLAALLGEPDWLGVDFGRMALRLAQRLAP
ncbi:CYTH domain-containing protein [Billgrantia pellis]|uniref:CYTH domain-containing protein n=1 Tax=Billgrantia pellis TaxID=2606936 RepID=A0A7V7KHP9_9GAMM|nr:CYTH domain-containing protein [Halomonas pellis]KAA0012029.1 CYTH domain-containing protein [Halomonas pellis]